MQKRAVVVVVVFVFVFVVRIVGRSDERTDGRTDVYRGEATNTSRMGSCLEATTVTNGVTFRSFLEGRKGGTNERMNERRYSSRLRSMIRCLTPCDSVSAHDDCLPAWFLGCRLEWSLARLPDMSLRRAVIGRSVGRPANRPAGRSVGQSVS